MTVLFSPPCAVFSLHSAPRPSSDAGAAARLRRLRRSSSLAASPQPQLSAVAAPSTAGEQQRGLGVGVASPLDYGDRGSLKELPLPRGVADDARLHNPLVRTVAPPRCARPQALSKRPAVSPPPLQERLERLGTGWMGAVFEWEGVVVDDRSASHKEVRAHRFGLAMRSRDAAPRPLTPPQAWCALAAELKRSPPPAWQLARLVGMKSSQARARPALPAIP